MPMLRRAVAAATTALLLLLLGVSTAQAAPSGDTMRPGDSLAPGEWIMSADRSHGLTYQSDGDLVVYGPRDRAIWTSGTAGRGVGRFAMGFDGNAGIVVPPDDQVLFQTGTFCGPEARLVVQNDGNVVVYCPGGAAFYTGWDRTGLDAGQALISGHRITSPNGRYHLTLQRDGNVVAYGPDRRPLFFTGTYGADSLRLQPDGNLVAYRGGTPVWHSDTWREGRVRLEVQDDGNVVLYRQNGSPAWYSAFDTGRAASGPSAGVKVAYVPPAPPTPAPLPAPAPAPAGAYYRNCDAARAAGVAPLYVGQPGYRDALDRDRDGIACEWS